MPNPKLTALGRKNITAISTDGQEETYTTPVMFDREIRFIHDPDGHVWAVRVVEPWDKEHPWVAQHEFSFRPARIVIAEVAEDEP